METADRNYYGTDGAKHQTFAFSFTYEMNPKVCILSPSRPVTAVSVTLLQRNSTTSP